MGPDLKEESRRWFLQAQADLEDTIFSFKGERFNLACFLAQQSAEKLLKSYLYFKEVDNPWGHSVADLCALAAKFDKDFKEIKKEGALLDKYYIPTRYPNVLPGGIPKEAFDKYDAQKAIAITKKIATIVKGKIKI